MQASGHTSSARIRKAATRQMALWGTVLAITFAGAVAEALTLTAVQSRKAHGAASFDLPIDTAPAVGGAVTVESRAIGTGHRIVFQFDMAVGAGTPGVPAAVDETGASVGSVTATASGNNEVVVTLAGVPDNKRVTISLANVNGIGLDVFASLGFLVGDVNNSGSVSATDISRLKARAGQGADATSAGYDVNASGAITAADISAVKARSGRTLPAVALTYTLNVSKTGVGAGTVTSSPAGINCGADCTQNYPSGTVVTLSAAAGSGSTFNAWGGACTGAGTCIVTIDAAKSVSAGFAPENLMPPADPATVAPPINPTVATDIANATAFLYSGANPIQSGVALGTIEARRTAVLRGRVQTRDAAPLSAVKITILAHAEFGQTLTRVDGAFDLAVNGGGQLTVRYEKNGFLPVQRAIVAPWRDYAWLPDVVMISLDPVVTTINAGAASMQTARGSPVSDADGVRRATMLFPAGTTAMMVLPNGSTQPLTTLNVRATEYTVGDSGPKAMPAALPPSSGYTYAVELSVDEAIAAGAAEVRFSQAVPTYVENFLGFPVGGAVPAGYYDRIKGQWIASANGRVIRILAAAGGVASLDIDGTGNAATAGALAALGVTADELARLAQLYAAGQTLWRTPITHFTPWDMNWPYGPPPDAKSPPENKKKKNPPLKKPTKRCGSVIGCEDQTLGESISIVGTPWHLHYQSERTPGRINEYTLEIPVSGPTVPLSLRRMRVEVTIGGRLHQATFAPAPNVNHVITWDGKDAYGRGMQGVQPVWVHLYYDYDPVYYPVPADFFASFARAVGTNALPVTRTTGGYLTLQTQWLDSVGAWGAAPAAGFAGWNLSMHHAYDPVFRKLYMGDGGERSAEANAVSLAVTSVTGDTGGGFSGDGGQVKLARFSTQLGMETGADGSIYVADRGNNRIRRIAPNGIVSTIAGVGGVLASSGDGGPATAAQLDNPAHVAVGPDGSVYFVEFYRSVVRRIDASGIISTVAGNGTLGFSGDGGPATMAQLNEPGDIKVGRDGSLFIADVNNSRVRRVGPDGIITTVAGNGTGVPAVVGGPADATSIGSPYGIALGADGSLFIGSDYYFMGSDRSFIYRVGADGIINIHGGNGFRAYAGDGGPALSASLSSPFRMLADRAGRLWFIDRLYGGPFAGFTYRLRRIDADGIINTIAGGDSALGFTEGMRAATMKLPFISGIASAPDGSVYLQNESSILRLSEIMPGFQPTDWLLPSEEGDEIFLFNGSGRHLSTRDALTGAIRLQFGYDAGGYLTSITDGSGNVTAVERSGATVTAIVAPGGRRTTLNVNAAGWLAIAANPAGQAHTMTYSASGLLQTFTDPRGQLHTFTYNALGLLTRDDNPAGGSTTLVRTEQVNGHTVTTTSTLGRTESFQVELLPTGAMRRTLTAASGTKTITDINTDGSEQTTYADGSTRTASYGPDPRWGMLAPVVKSDVFSTPGGITRTVTATRSATLSALGNPLSLTNLTYNTRENGKLSTRVFTSSGSTRTLTETSAAGRIRTTSLDAMGRVTQVQMSGLDPVAYTYEGRSLINTITEGSGINSRTTTLAYNAAYELTGVTDALGRTTGLTYDSAGRLTTSTLPGARTVTLAYDAAGNISALTPPGRTLHGFTYSPIDDTASYTPPSLGSGTTTTQYTYDTDQALTRVTRPDGQLIDVTYDAAGRPSTLAIARGSIGYNYSPTTDLLMAITAPGGNGLSYTRDSELLTGVTWSGTVSGAMSYTYNNDLRPTVETINGANSVSFTYAADGLLDSAGSLALTRNAQNGLVTGSTLGNLIDSHAYNTLAEHSSYSASYNAAAIYNAVFTRDALGRVTQMVETISGVGSTYGYSYDAAGRLAAVSKDAVPASTYAYDPNGNRTARTGPTLSATHDAQDRLTGYGGNTYTYTAGGELQGKVNGAASSAYQYDALGNLMSVTLPNASVIDYLIDGLNRRIGKKINGTLVQGFLYQGSLRPIAELDGGNAIVSRFVYATRVNVPDYLVKGGVTYRIIADRLGSPRLVVDVATGTVAQRLDYDEFGQVLNDTNPGFQPFGFAGGLYDKDTKLVRFGARDYNAETGRWTAKDPIGFTGGDTNLYAYAGNDPVNFIDSSGLKSTKLGGCLFVRSKDVKVLKYPNAQTGVQAMKGTLQPGDEVKWLGFDQATGFDRVEVSLPDGSTVQGYISRGDVLHPNLSTTPPDFQIRDGGKPMSSHAYPSSGVGTKG